MNQPKGASTGARFGDLGTFTTAGNGPAGDEFAGFYGVRFHHFAYENPGSQALCPLPPEEIPPAAGSHRDAAGQRLARLFSY